MPLTAAALVQQDSDDETLIFCYNSAMKPEKPLLIVIDGTDGSGKATQTKLLLERLDQEDIPVETVAFPRYDNPAGVFTEEYLSGKYGTASEVGAKAASIFYAVDRFDASFEIRDWISSGKTVIIDRYVTANMGHQGGKISDPAEREAFFKWNDELEHEIFKIPRPDFNIVLHVPTDIAIKLAKARGGWKGDLKTDIHETDTWHLRDAEEAYLHLAKVYPNTYLVECTKDDQMRSREDIQNEIWQIITSHKK